jgi:hypothetical protein
LIEKSTPYTNLKLGEKIGIAEAKLYDLRPFFLQLAPYKTNLNDHLCNVNLFSIYRLLRDLS